MEIIPSIDLKGGKCIRLYQGDYKLETVFSQDPIGMALHWQSLGAPRLHIVDLDGAFKGELFHKEIIKRIAEAVKIPLQVGGGIRRLETMEQLLGIGVQRVILGTAAVEDPQLVEEACRQFGESILIAVDAREGYVSTYGWQKRTNITAIELVQKTSSLGARRFIYTDISRDGTLSEPNFTAIAELARSTKLPIIASGGISSIAHLKRLKGLGVEGAIVGRALYTGDIDLKEALVKV